MWITQFNVFLVIVQLTCFQNVDAWGMLGKCLTRCHLEMWSLGCLPKSGQYYMMDICIYIYIYIYWVINYLIEKLQATMWDTCWDLPYAQTFLNFILLHSSM